MKRQASIGELFAKKSRHGHQSVTVECSTTASGSTITTTTTTTESLVASSDMSNPDGESAIADVPLPQVSDEPRTISCANPVWPCCWTRKQWQYFTHENEWLICNNKKIGCSTCSEAGNLGVSE